MKTMVGAVMTLALMTPAFGGAKDPNGGPPQYDVKTEVDFVGTIAKVTEVPSGEALAGIHLTMRSKSDTIEVYLAPAAFIKLVAVPLRAGSKSVGITGSKVTFEGTNMVLARELRIDNIVLSLRDEAGLPNWLWTVRTAIPNVGF